MFTCICWLRASYYEFVNTIRRVQTYLKGNSWSMFWETFLDPITFREIRKHNHILISMNEIRTPPWQQTNDWLTARKTKPYVMANDDVAKRQHIFLASLFARCYRSRYWKFEFTVHNHWALLYLEEARQSFFSQTVEAKNMAAFWWIWRHFTQYPWQRLMVVTASQAQFWARGCFDTPLDFLKWYFNNFCSKCERFLWNCFMLLRYIERCTSYTCFICLGEDEEWKETLNLWSIAMLWWSWSWTLNKITVTRPEISQTCCQLLILPSWRKLLT